MSQKLFVPDIGNFEKVEIIELLVKVGDKIKLNDPVVTIESDKSSIEIPSIIEGTIEQVNVKVGDKVSKGDLLLNISPSIEISSEKIIPKDTESIIKEAETNLKNKKENFIQQKPKKKETITQFKNENDIDPLETKDWIESMSAVLKKDGKHRAQFLIKELIDYSYKEGSDLVLSRNTPYINTISPESETKSKGDQNIERRIRSLIRWNAAAMVVPFKSQIMLLHTMNLVKQ